MEKIGIVNLGVGNLNNVQQAFGGKMIDRPEELYAADRVVLPGVGAFSAVSQRLEEFRVALLEVIQKGVPLLGICLGLQLLADQSDEGHGKGLSIFSGRSVRFIGALAPHIGWNQVHWQQEHPLALDIPSGSFFYFVHNYYVSPDDHKYVLSQTDYSKSEDPFAFCSSFVCRNVAGVQFHPEKSSQIGQRMIDNFLRWSP